MTTDDGRNNEGEFLEGLISGSVIRKKNGIVYHILTKWLFLTALYCKCVIEKY